MAQKQSIVKDSSKIRELLKVRMNNLDLTYSAVCIDAQEKGQYITPDKLSKYFNQDDRGGLTEENIVFLCFRYGILISLNVTRMEPFNEQKCIEITQKLFPYEKNDNAKHNNEERKRSSSKNAKVSPSVSK